MKRAQLKFFALLLILSACSVYKNPKLDERLTPQAQAFLLQNGLADKRKYKDGNIASLSPELQSYITPSGKVAIQDATSNSDCHDPAGAIGWLLTAGMVSVECENSTQVCYESEPGKCTKNYGQLYQSNSGGFLQLSQPLYSDEWSYSYDYEKQYNNSIITSLNKLVQEQTGQ